MPKNLMRYMILKGIVVLNGIALTLIRVDDKRGEIEVALIPHTWKETNLHVLKVGAKVNVETDLIAKYLERLITK
jgi:riboflavin synthase